jgi:hypothetical protein
VLIDPGVKQMAKYERFLDQVKVQRVVDHLRSHHDHLKTMDDSYRYMKQEETYERMHDPAFQCIPEEMEKFETSCFTSLIIKLSVDQGKVLLEIVERAYREIANLILQFDPSAKISMYFDSAHITVNSLVDGVRQSKDALAAYMPVIAPIVRRWIEILGPSTTLYGMGLFTNLHRSKGLSVGVRFYSGIPLVQTMRKEVGVALYGSRRNMDLRAESAFHTTLTHSTGFRARNLSFPLDPGLISAFHTIIEKYDRFVFGAIHNILPEDVYVRNGLSDRLVPISEICVAGFS